MSLSEREKEQLLEKEYYPYVHKVGRVFCTALIFCNILPVILVGLVYGLVLDWKATLAAWGMIAMLLIPFYVTEPWMYYAVLGTAGNYMQWAGNTSNCRLPCAAITQSVMGVKEGTPDGEIIANIAVATSIVVNMLIVLAASVAGFGLVWLAQTYPFIKAAFDNILPAIFGAIYAQFSLRNPAYGAMLLAIGIALVWFGLPYWQRLLIMYVVGLGVAFSVYKKWKKTLMRKE